ncbi:hypothetical protein [Brucella anthropi]|uniref:hypothetical protein n=1 Tax=Brucella anthropi TaxID=529 RepID=UPI000E05FB44|nr:hypothetical protein [Brucella anthropi]SUB43711.1 Uncharacterised protein [Brucella anthropi]
MEQLRQVDIAEALNISEPSASRLMRALNRSALPLNDLDIVKALTVGELAQLGFTMAVGAELMKEVEQEVRYVFEGHGRKCWILFVETEKTVLSRSSPHSRSPRRPHGLGRHGYGSAAAPRH